MWVGWRRKGTNQREAIEGGRRRVVTVVVRTRLGMGTLRRPIGRVGDQTEKRVWMIISIERNTRIPGVGIRRNPAVGMRRRKEGGERDREQERKERREKEREREKDKEKERRKERAREEREVEREREREERNQERERDKDKERERKRRELDKDDERDYDDYERKRSKRDGDSRDRDPDQSRSEREENEDHKRRKSEDNSFAKEKKTQEEVMEEEQRKLYEEMDKRRRRVQEWQEQRRKKEESELEKVEQPEQEAGKKWSLNSDDEETALAVKSEKDQDSNQDAKIDMHDEDPMAIDTGDETALPNLNGNIDADADEELDPLDAFMKTIEPEVEKLNSAVSSTVTESKAPKLIMKDKKDIRVNGKPGKSLKKALGRIIPGEDSGSDYEDVENDEVPLEEEEDDEFMKRVKKTKA